MILRKFAEVVAQIADFHDQKTDITSGGRHFEYKEQQLQQHQGRESILTDLFYSFFVPSPIHNEPIKNEPIRPSIHAFIEAEIRPLLAEAREGMWEFSGTKKRVKALFEKSNFSLADYRECYKSDPDLILYFPDSIIQDLVKENPATLTQF